MKTFMFILILILSFRVFSQVGCDPSLNSTVPPSPYIDGYLTFDGKGDFLRSDDLNTLEFPAATTDNFSITFKMKISQPYKPMYIFGKYRSAGWMVGYNTSESGYLSLLINNSWKRIYQLSADTSWHDYAITYSKQEQMLKTFVDGVLTNSYENFSYVSMADNCAFSVGNVGFFAQYGPQSVNLNSYWFKGSIAAIKILANNSCLVNYGFNEGGGQVARDSLTYYYSDRSYPGSSVCGIAHLMLGYMPSSDTCDPVWSAFDAPVVSRFHELGSGTQYWYSNNGMEFYAEHFSTSLTTYNGMLVNGGYFNLAGGNTVNNIAVWDGSNWSPLGSGLSHEPLALSEYRGELYAAGFFDTAGGVPVRYIAKWNGSQWQDVGGGFDNIANVMYKFGSDLIIGGWFTTAGGNIAASVVKWDGSHFTAMSSGMTGPVYALKEFRGELYAGGEFTFASGTECYGIARWDGSKWNPVGTGLAGGEATIYTLEVYNNELYAGGNFIKMNNIFCYNIAKYDGTAWRPLGGGATGAMCNQSRGYVNSLKTFNNELYAAGQFSLMDGVTANKLARFNGANWCQVEYGVDLRPRALEVYNDDLIINGDFYSASGIACNNIVSYTPVRNLTGTGNNNNSPATYSLQQNYPNPFNPKTNIKFSIPTAGFVSLKVFDITGKEMAVLVNESKTAGAYNIDFDASNLSSGIYIYRLESAGTDGAKFTESKKMVLLK